MFLWYNHSYNVSYKTGLKGKFIMPSAFNYFYIETELFCIDYPAELAASVKEKEKAGDMSFSFVYEILHNKKSIYKSTQTTERSHKYEITKPGTYVVRIWVYSDSTSLDYIQKTIHCYSKHQKDCYEAFLRNAHSLKTAANPPGLHLLESPNQLIAIISAYSDTIESLIPCVKQLGLLINILQDDPLTNKTIAVISQTEGNNIWFSGKAIYNNRLIIGQEDIDDTINTNELRQSIGNHTELYKDRNNYVFSNDYYGLYRIFYYKNTDVAVISNSYHLIILVLKNAKVKLSFDTTLASIPLLSREGLFMQQKFCHNMDIVGIKMLPIDSRISITVDGIINIFKKEWGMVLDGEIQNKSYEELMSDIKYTPESGHNEVGVTPKIGQMKIAV